ncbi:MAG TPA: 23S rRNA (guanosine(2251)-2'-O)-methyltransferase RlmB [Anaerolineales bacterium]|nr:23S rRNA (guanosine(2251)-2'-O)-methyltransferase RlmB [Anaerolineales bacterium]
MAEFLYRRNVVLEALRAGRRDFKRLIIASDANRDSLRDVLAEAQRRKIKIDQRLTKELNTITHGENHQGVVLEVGPYLYAEFDEPLARAHSAGEPPLLLLLDQVQDPANVGRLLRTAEACGAHGVYMPEKGSGEITPAVVTASMGASEHMRVVRAGNMARAIEMLKQQDVWIAGLDLSPEAQQFDQVDLKRSLGIVVGNEGAGIRRLVREKCDMLLRLPMRGRVQSLNAAIAGSIMLYAAWQARGFRS